MQLVLVTGATGFVGRSLCRRLISEGFQVRGTLLPDEGKESLLDGVQAATVEPLGPDMDWSRALEGVEAVIHLAARVHIMDDAAADPLAEFRRVNVAGTEALARQAVRAGVRRFVFVSSIKVNGEEATTPYTEDSPPNPADPYGISKHEAERALRRIESEAGLEVAVVRPTLVYGPGVRANFLKLMGVVARGLPLPLGMVANRRSLIYVENLADALALVVAHPQAAGRTYLVSDGEDLSTPELICRLAQALEAPSRLLPVPCPLLRLMGRLTGKGASVDRLLGSLAVDSSRIRAELTWRPPYTLEQGLRETAIWFTGRTKGSEREAHPVD